MTTQTTTTRTRRPRKTDATKPEVTRETPVRAEVVIPSERPVEGYVVDLQAEGTETERTFAKLLAKDPNSTHVAFKAWFLDATGVELDIKTVQYTLATYHEFQRSPEHREATQAKRTAAAQAKAERELQRVERAKAALAKAEAAAKAAKATKASK